MPYATLEQMTARYGENAVIVASDRTNTGTMDADIVTTTLTDVSSIIDSYLGKRYELPLPTVPESLIRCAVDMAMYQMSADANVATKQLEKRNDDCLAHLKDLSRGIAALAVEPDNPQDTEPTGSAYFESAERIFTTDTLRGF